jgi:ribosomal-protein-alanine N-acetyltransferase
MVVLALETVTRAGSLALAVDGACHVHPGDPSRTHGERLPGEILALLAAHRLAPAAVDRFAVVTGPGSFTGLRVGIATIQGLAVGTGRPVVPVSTLDALVAAWRHGRPDVPAVVVACVDGQRGDVFFALYAVEPAGGAEASRLLMPPLVGRPEEAAALIASRLGDRSCVLIGSGADIYQAAFTRQLPGARVDPVRETLAAAAARLASGPSTQPAHPRALAPVYVRRPDAVIARDRHRAGWPAMPPPPPAAGGFVVARAHTVDDIAAVEALQDDAFDRPWGAGSFRWALERSDVARLYVMRSPSGELVGYCACWLLVDELHINSVAVAAAWQRRGLASTLLRAVARDAAAAGATSATLEVRESNQAARALYERLGFQVEAVRRDYYREPREDALILWHRSLDRLPERACRP